MPTDRRADPRPLTVGFLVDRWEPARGGAERAMAALARHLERRGDRVLAFSRRAASEAPGEFVAVDANGPGPLAWARTLTRSADERAFAAAATRAAEAGGCDVTIGLRHLAAVDVFWPHGGAHAESLLARRRARANDPALPSAPARGRHRVFVDLERALCEAGGARHIVCVSELVRDELARAWPACAERTVVIENGVDLERFHPDRRAREGATLRARLRIPDEVPVIAFAAREPVLKGLPALAAALARLLDRPWHLIVAGPRHPARWRRRLRRAGLPEGRAHLFDHLEPVELFAAADLLVQPTWRDPFSLATLEALACGTPVVTTRANGAARLLEGAGAGAGTVLATPGAGGDGGELAAALAARLERLGDGARDSDRAAARESVLDHGEAPWLERLEAVVRAAARARSA